MDESCNGYERVMSHIWTSHVTHMNESRHTYEWVMWTSCEDATKTASVVKMRGGTACHTYQRVMSYIRMSQITHIHEACHTYEFVNWAIQMIWRIHTCDMPHVYVWCDSFVCMTWHVHTCDMPTSKEVYKWGMLDVWIIYIHVGCRHVLQATADIFIPKLFWDMDNLPGPGFRLILKKAEALSGL